MAKNDPKVDRLGVLRAVNDALSAEIERGEKQQARKKKRPAPRKPRKTSKR